MSSNRMPGVGKSGNWRRDFCSLILRPGSSEEVEAWEGDCLGFWFWVASGRSRGGCSEVEGDMVREKEGPPVRSFEELYS